MGIRAFFHRIKIGFVRMGGVSIPYTPPEKRYGNLGEDHFAELLREALPNCRMKRNILITTDEGNAEIDCLVLYKNKLFAIEIKRWIGDVLETETGFVQRKADRWTGETHTKIQKSPFRQINRAIYLLKKQVPQTAWINAIVFFDGASRVRVNGDETWFIGFEDLVHYIATEGMASYENSAQRFFEDCTPADCLYSSSNHRMRCRISPDSLRFQTSTKLLTREDISVIRIVHHWSYDDLQIDTHDGQQYHVNLENDAIAVIDNGKQKFYSFSKLREIRIGAEES